MGRSEPKLLNLFSDYFIVAGTPHWSASEKKDALTRETEGKVEQLQCNSWEVSLPISLFQTVDFSLPQPL